MMITETGTREKAGHPGDLIQPRTETHAPRREQGPNYQPYTTLSLRFPEKTARGSRMAKVSCEINDYLPYSLQITFSSAPMQAQQPVAPTCWYCPIAKSWRQKHRHDLEVSDIAEWRLLSLQKNNFPPVSKQAVRWRYVMKTPLCAFHSCADIFSCSNRLNKTSNRTQSRINFICRCTQLTAQ